MEALFDLPTPKTTKPRRVLNPFPRVSRTPTWRPCPTCKAWELAAMADDGLFEVTVDPTSLDATAIQVARILGRSIWRAPMNALGRPTELWSVLPGDPPEREPWRFYWLADHACHAPPLPGSGLAIQRPDPQPVNPPY